MNIIAKIFKILFHPQSVVLLVAAALVLLVLRFRGRFGITGRLPSYLIIGIIAVALVIEIVLTLRRRRKSEQVEEVSLIREADAGVASAQADQKRAREAARQEVSAAIEALKRSSVAGHALPWFMVLGAEGSGKSTLVRNSGLRVSGRPSDEMKAIGSSRHCEWSFTNQAVVLEADRRFVAPAKDKAAERDWSAFLERLRQTRQPALNGVVITISAEELSQGDGQRLEAQIQLLRRRLDDLSRGLRLVFPVYVVVTKIDLVHGFGEFFGDLSGAARDQIWGATLSGALMAQTAPAKLFDQEFQLLFHTLLKRRMPRLVREERSERMGGIYLFPLEFHALRARLRRCIEGLFAPGAYEHGPLLRGLYFASGGGGGGQPAEVVLTEVSRVIGLPTDPFGPYAPYGSGPGGADDPYGSRGAPVASGSPAPPYFLANLFLNVIIPDYAIARPTAGATRRYRRMHLLAAAVAGLLLLFCGVWMVTSFVGNRRLLRETQRVVHDYSTNPATSRTPGMPGNLRLQLEQLDPLRRQLLSLDKLDTRADFPHGLWLYRGREVNRQARSCYLEGLERVLFAPSRAELDRKLMEARPWSWGEFYAPYGAYRMLCDCDLYDADLLAAQLGILWGGRGDGGGTELSKRIHDHVSFAETHKDDLRHNGPRPAPELVARFQNLWRNSSDADPQLTALIEAANKKVPPFTLASVLGEQQLLVAKGGARVDGAFTVAGWDTIKASFAETGSKLIPDCIMADLREGGRSDVGSSAFLPYYVSQYIDNWNRFLESVAVSQRGGLPGTKVALKELAKKDSSFYLLLKEIASNVEFGKHLNVNERETYSDLLNIDMAFKTLRAFSEEKDGVGPEDFRANNYRAEFIILAEKVAELAAADSGQKPGNGEPLMFERLDNIAKQFCERSEMGAPASNTALKTFLRGPAQSVQQACWGESRAELWRKVFARYESLAKKYPFDRASPNDVTPREFGEFFGGEQGILKVFMESVPREHAAQANGAGAGDGDAGLGSEMNEALKAAAAIRRAFGLENGDEPQLTFNIRPRQLARHQSIYQITPGKAIAYSTGISEFWPYKWPQAGDGLTASVALKLEDGSIFKHEQKGVWAFFRLLDMAKITSQPDNLYRLDWDFDDDSRQRFQASYDLKPQPRDNPFARDFFEQFKLPASLGQ